MFTWRSCERSPLCRLNLIFASLLQGATTVATRLPVAPAVLPGTPAPHEAFPFTAGNFVCLSTAAVVGMTLVIHFHSSMCGRCARLYHCPANFRFLQTSLWSLRGRCTLRQKMV